ncbi:hypothetical protein EDB89DRAFT_2229397 [Lactarius sanguifluus]|nr:hypothetical protein EDB89DRAFT_2229397 [Lactarius sanguifluus]
MSLSTTIQQCLGYLPNPFSLSKMIATIHLATSDDQLLARKFELGAIMVFLGCYYRYLIPARRIGTHKDVTLSAIQKSLAALKEGSAFAAKLPYLTPIAGLLLQALTMRDARVTYFLLTTCVLTTLQSCEYHCQRQRDVWKHNLNEEDLPASLLAILGSLQISELETIERVLEKCPKKKAPST